MSPKVFPASPLPAGYLQPTESFYAYGGCAVINDFDVPGQAGYVGEVSHRYNNATTGPAAALARRRRTRRRRPRGSTSRASGTTSSATTTPTASSGLREPSEGDPRVVPEHRCRRRSGSIRWRSRTRLEDNYPNPFNPTTTIKYSIADRGQVTLKIYNAAGQLVRTLVNEEQAPAGGRLLARSGTD